MSQRMKALRGFNLRGNKISPGDVFPVKDNDVLLLAISKLAEIYDEKEAETTPAAAKAAAPRKSSTDSAAKQPAKTPQKNLDAMTLDELRALARTMAIPSAGLRKAELLEKVRRGRYARRDMRAG